MQTLNVNFDHVKIEDNDVTLTDVPGQLWGNPLLDQSGQLNRRDLVVGKVKLHLGFMSVGKTIDVIFDYQGANYVGNGNIVSATNDLVTIHFKLS